MASCTAQVRLAASGGLPENTIINTFHFNTANKLAATGDAIRDALLAFYNVIDGFMSTFITATGHEVRIYDRGDPVPRTPWYTQPLGTLTRGSTEGMPPEVALVMSIQGFRSSGVPLPRTRGRVYLGPFTEASSSNGRPSPTLLTAVHDAGAGLLAASNASAAYEWEVYSPTDNAEHAVIGGWVDDEWDIIRSRGIQATTRSVYGTLT